MSQKFKKGDEVRLAQEVFTVDNYDESDGIYFIKTEDLEIYAEEKDIKLVKPSFKANEYYLFTPKRGLTTFIAGRYKVLDWIPEISKGGLGLIAVEAEGVRSVFYVDRFEDIVEYSGTNMAGE